MVADLGNSDHQLLFLALATPPLLCSQNILGDFFQDSAPAPHRSSRAPPPLPEMKKQSVCDPPVISSGLLDGHSSMPTLTGSHESSSIQLLCTLDLPAPPQMYLALVLVLHSGWSCPCC